MAKSLNRREILLGAACLPALTHGALAAAEVSHPFIRLPVDANTFPITGLLGDGKASGMIESALDLIKAELGWAIDYEIVPWKRAQEYVREGKLDGLCTRPTAERQEYLRFAAAPLFTLDSNWAHFSADNPRADEIRQIKTLDQLKSFRIGLGRGNSWPNDLFGPGWQTTEVATINLIDAMVRAGRVDLFFDIPEVTHYWQRANGVPPLASIHLDVLPDGMIPFIFGLRRSFHDAERLMSEFDRIHKKLVASGAIDRALTPFRT